MHRDEKGIKQISQDIRIRNAGPRRKKDEEKESSTKIKEEVLHLEELPLDGNNAGRLVRDLGECTRGEIHAVRVLACRASIGDGDGHALAVVRVNDLCFLAAERGDLAGIAVAARVDGGDEVRVGVHGSARTGDAVLREKGREAAGDEAAAAARCSGRGLGG